MKNISQLIELARRVKMSQNDKTEQRNSFVYGNTKLENASITKELVAELSAASSR